MCWYCILYTTYVFTEIQTLKKRCDDNCTRNQSKYLKFKIVKNPRESWV